MILLASTENKQILPLSSHINKLLKQINDTGISY